MGYKKLDFLVGIFSDTNPFICSQGISVRGAVEAGGGDET